MKSGRGTLAAVMLIALSSLGAPAGAAPSARARAKALFQEGEVHFEEGRHAAALRSYEQAFELLPLPAFIFNIAQCHRNLGRHEEAIEAYERYLKEAGPKADRAFTEQLIAESKEALRESSAPAPTPDVSAPETADATDVPTLSTPPIEMGDTTAPSASQTVTAPIGGAEESEIYERGWFWPVVLGVAAVAIGGTVIALASSGGETITVPPSGSAGTIDWR